MADSKVSDLTAATTTNNGDFLYLVQSNTSKKITIGNFLGDAGNVTLKGNINIGDTPQELAAAGLINLNTPITLLSLPSGGGTLQIHKGTAGQVKYLILTSATSGTYTLNNANVAGGGNVVFDTAGDTATLLYQGAKWYVIGGTANVTY